MIELKSNKVVSTKTTKSFTINNTDMVRLLIEAGYYVPTKASVTVLVPGGGDWCNETLDIDSDTPIIVKWSEDCVEDEE
jgi:hypothetical protein